MARLRVFIASSGNAMPLAEALCSAMKEFNERPLKELGGPEKSDSTVSWAAPHGSEESNAKVSCDVIPWWDKQNTLQYGKALINGLVDECRAADLAVILLTQDDYVVKNGGAANSNNANPANSNNADRVTSFLKPRDNCIFEAGLFMGGLGLDAQRSVLVTPVMEPGALPSDLDGVLRVVCPPLDKDKDKTDQQWRERAAKHVARELALHVGQLRDPPMRPVLQVLSPRELIKRETAKKDGGDLVPQPAIGVVVNTTQPAETGKIGLARTVVRNMLDLGIEYVYFFKGVSTNATAVANLLSTLTIARFVEDGEDPEHHERQALLTANAVPALDHLRRIQKKLSIHFRPRDRAPLLFCVHNAEVEADAKCYLRDTDGEHFVLLARKTAALDIANDLLNDRTFDKAATDPAVFFSTKSFDLYGDQGRALRDALEVALARAFPPEMVDGVKKICFYDTPPARAIQPPALMPGKPAPMLPGRASFWATWLRQSGVTGRTGRGLGES